MAYKIVIWWALYIIILLFISYLSVYHQFSFLTGFLITVGVFTIENLVAGIQKHLSLFFAKKLLVISIASLIVYSVVCLFYFLYPFLSANKSLLITLEGVFQYVILGLIVGTIFRKMLLSYSINHLFDRSTDIQRLALLSCIMIFLWLFPFAIYHQHYAVFYLFGFSGGLVLHFVLRRFVLHDANISRRARTLLAMINNDSVELTETEKHAFKLVTGQKWKDLSKLFLKLEANKKMSTRLVIIKACMFRIRGKYADALVLLNKELSSETRDASLDNLLYLQKALALGEVEDDQAMYEVLELSEQRNSRCFLYQITRGLREAEKLELHIEDISKTSEERERPLELIRGALHKNALEKDAAVLSRLVGHSIPISWGFLQDAYGYALLKAGDFVFSKSLLLDCIENEPHISSTYLHLGEWYLAYRMNHPDREKHYSELAKLCFSIAIRLEGDRDSRIARRARSFILNPQNKSKA
ncbi:MAG: hypothetical protein ACRBF0_15185 [Calditrichia bacterium]